jgi:tetratricopeptide (TPR) repeat protein
VTKPTNNVFPLGAIRTDGWFERVSASIGSFELLCDILGEAFVAFSLITGARVTALTLDRHRPNDTLVDFEVGEQGEARGQRLTLEEFRQRLTNALCTVDPVGPAPERQTDTQGIQQHLGARYLLLAPLFGYSLEELRVHENGSTLLVHFDGKDEVFSLEDFQELLRGYVMQEFYRADEAVSERRSGIDLSLVDKAERAAAEGRHAEIVELLGSWLTPLTILLRTPDGARLDQESRVKLANALGLLGSALQEREEAVDALSALRLSVQYALETPFAPQAYERIGRVLMAQKRFGEAIAPLRRSINLGGPDEVLWPALARCFLECNRLLAALGASLEAFHAGSDDPEASRIRKEVFSRIPALEAWERLVASARPATD